MNKTQKLIGAMLISLGMAHGVAFAQQTYSNAGGQISNGIPSAADNTTRNYTINSGYEDGTTTEVDALGAPTGNFLAPSSGNVVIQSMTHDGTNPSVASSMTISPTGVEFKGAGGSGPVKVTGVANGTSTYDAVNFGQLSAVQTQVNDLSKTVDTMKSGIASVAAMANIPASNDPKQRVSIGAGVGGYMGKTASAIGATVRITKNLTAKASFSSASGGESTSGVGIAYGW